MPRDLLERLDEWKHLYGTADTSPLERLLAQAAQQRFKDSASLIRLHETLLFLRAYPHSAEIARLADGILLSFAGRLPDDLTAFEEPDISGIAGTSFSAIFSYDAARALAARYPRDVAINWDSWQTDHLGAVLRRFLPGVAEDWPVEANVPYRDWIQAASGGGESNLRWLLDNFATLDMPERDRADLYDSMRLPLTWSMGGAGASRSHLRVEAGPLYCHQEPLLRRSGISLQQELDAPPLPIARLDRGKSRAILDLIVHTSATRYRELYGFHHPDPARVYHASAGRGLDIYFFGIPPEWRLPLRAYHSGMFFKNGVPAGYIEVLSLFERAEVGFNLYYTFREGESAWIYARLLRLLRQMLGVTCFSVDPYQLGHENEEALDSGAFWFYRKLGFRALNPEIAQLVAREELKMKRTPAHRSSRRTLQKLARDYILFESAGTQTGDWDRFRARNLALSTVHVCDVTPLEAALHRIPDFADWPAKERAAAFEMVKAKSGPDEARYLRLMQRNPRLRAAFLQLGSSPPTS